MSLDTILARQAGVISREQALAAGLSRDAVDHRVRLRRWRPLHPRVYLAGGHRVDDEVTVRAALLWAGEGAVLSGVAAAWWHGLVESAPATVAITVGRRRHPRSRAGVAVRRRDIPAEDRVVSRGLVVTGLPLTVLEAAVELGPPGSLLLDRALQRRVRFPEVQAAQSRNLGAYGSASAARLLAAAADRSAVTARRLLVRLLREAGAAGWHCDFPVPRDLPVPHGLRAAGGTVDVAFPAARVAVEVDGWAWHADGTCAQQRRAALVRQGWTVLHYAWHDLAGRPRAVLAEIAAAVGRGTTGR